MTTAEFEAAIAGAWQADIVSEPEPAMPAVVDALSAPCWCGATAAERVYVWRPGGRSTVAPRCRDHRDVGDLSNGGTR